MSAPKPTIAFFGATGGTIAATLGLALSAGYTCYALARTPSKLETLLEQEHAVPAQTITTRLTIVKGDIKNVSDIVATLAPQGKNVATIIASGIGTLPVMKLSIRAPIDMKDPTICGDGMRAMVQAIERLRSQGVYPPLASEGSRSPLIIAVSTTGLDRAVNDVPYAYHALYHWLLHLPHMDKKRMETILVESGNDFIILRPTILLDGDALGQDKIRVGWVRHFAADSSLQVAEEQSKPAIGYSIRRRDVGTWIFENGIQQAGQGWRSKCVSLTS